MVDSIIERARDAAARKDLKNERLGYFAMENDDQYFNERGAVKFN